MRGLTLSLTAALFLLTGGGMLLALSEFSVGLTPKQAAYFNSPFCKGSAKIAVHRRDANTAIALCSDLPERPDGGYIGSGTVVRNQWGLWTATANGGSVRVNSNSFATLDGLLWCSHAGPTQSVYTSEIFSGQTRSPDIKAVEVTLSNGQTLRSDVEQGLFTLGGQFEKVGIQVTQVRLLGEAQELLQQFDAEQLPNTAFCEITAATN